MSWLPGWVRVVSAHREDRVRNLPCTHNPAEEQRARWRVRRDVEPPEVRRFLRQELLKKVGHSWWNRPRVRDLRSLPLTAKSDSSSRSSSDHGRSSQGRRSRSREPTPPQLMNLNIDDFTVVSHTTDSFTFTSAHPFFPGWVRVVSAHREDRVRNIPCTHNPGRTAG